MKLFKNNKNITTNRLQNNLESLISSNEPYDDYPKPVFQLDNYGKFTYCNKALIELIGYTKRYIYRYFNTFISDEYQGKMEHHFIEALNGLPQCFYSKLHPKNRDTLEIEVHLIPVTDEEKVSKVYGIIIDISELKDIQIEFTKIRNSLEMAQILAKIGSWEYNVATDQVSWSDQLLNLLNIQINSNFTPSIGKMIHFVHPDDRKQYSDKLQQSIQNMEGFHIDYRLSLNNTSEIYVREQARVINDSNGQPIKIIGTIQDISEQKKVELEIRESEKMLTDLYNNLEAGIWTYDIDKNRFIKFSKGIEMITGYKITDFEHFETWISIIHPDDLSIFNEQIKVLNQGKSLHHEYRIIGKNGEVIWIRAQAIPTLNEIGDLKLVMGIITDITASKNAELQIKYLAYHDYLTQLPNKRLIDDKLTELIRMNNRGEKRKFALLHLNLDRFKAVNDILGHEVGDKVLVKFSHLIKTILPTNTTFSRIGGDEFYILIWDYKEETYPSTLARKIIESLKKPIFISNIELFITTSIGISRYLADSKTENELRNNANTALKRAKLKGKNTYELHFPSSSISTYRLYVLERDLWKAIDNRELFLEFHPKVKANSGELVGAEALVRWKHPEWGIISPKDFIPLAEESGLILQIGDWVINEVCMFINRWNQKGLNLVPISINISTQRFLRNDWVDFIKSVISNGKVNPQLLEFEITETSLLHYQKETISDLTFLRKIGVKIALDDFGTGYSSLSYLKQFPIDTIKIDKSFIDKINSDLVNQAIIKSIIQLASDLNKNVVAEGVESIEQLVYLKKQNCPEIQGFLYSKPLSEHDFQLVLQKKFLHPIIKDQELVMDETFFTLDFPLAAEVRLISINKKDINIGSTKVLIEKIAPDRLRFFSNINLPVRKDFVYNLKIVIDGQEFSYNGYIIQKQAIYEVYEYTLLLIDVGEFKNLSYLLSLLKELLEKSTFTSY
ncbi:EAL domain-containing protein [Metabacillus litoralis]|uniref:sensor domain-containing phosphodiesterase n=1 Tax=Metabacillus litoralis TaxID=152268 RepID=UPI001E6002E6|nr:EAL domain-containing protein [Metabacillus litoralis]UHA60072.1 EAL domain-containing protein [Metabacillus litoralis]